MKCEYCKKEHDRKKWCSNECKMEAYKAGKRERNASRHEESTLQCEHCKVKFKPRTRLDERYCSNECKIEFHKAANRDKTADVRATIIKTCPICQNDFTPKKRASQTYCSRRCCYLLPKKMYKALQTCLEYTGGTKMAAFVFLKAINMKITRLSKLNTSKGLRYVFQIRSS